MFGTPIKLLGLLFLAACTPTAQATVDAITGQGVESAKNNADIQARLALQAPCSITIGAFNRLGDNARQRAVMALCGGSQERPITVEDLQRLLAE